jgi:predicted nucleotidyltransferase
MEPWSDAIERVRTALAALSGVEALAIFGSAARAGAELDAWSDIDALVVVADDALDQFFPAVGWLAPLGDLFTYEQSAGAHTRTTRCVFADGRRLDIVLTTASAAQTLPMWPSAPWWQGLSVVFAREDAVRTALLQRAPAPAPPAVAPEAVDALLRSFWFKGALAVTKVVRGDLLIALHLALDLQRDCAVLGMMLRDRAAGTTIHRTGGMGNAVVARLDATRAPFTAAGILQLIAHSGALCDALANAWEEDRHDQRGPLLDLIARARATLGVE